MFNHFRSSGDIHGGVNNMPYPKRLAKSTIDRIQVQKPLLVIRDHIIFGIPVVVEQEGNLFAITDYEINMYGVGNSIEDAEEDYESVVMSYLEDLNANEDQLSEQLKKHLYFLRERIESSFINNKINSVDHSRG